MVHFDLTYFELKERLADWWFNTNKTLLLLFVFLLLLGFWLSFSASAALASKHNVGPFYYPVRQISFAVLSLLTILVLSAVPTDWIRLGAYIGVVLSLIAMVVVLLGGTDFGKQGAVRWLSIPGVGLTIQPSEFLKPFLLVSVASILAVPNTNGSMVLRYAIVFGFTAISAVLLLLQPDYGQLILITACVSALVFVSGLPWRVCLLITLVVVLGGLGLYFYGADHFANRISAFLLPAEAGSQIDFALRSFDRGGLFGQGFGEDTQRRYLPDAYSDFILAVIGADWGLFTVLVITLFYGLIIAFCCVALCNEQDDFIRLSLLGLVLLFAGQFLIHSAVNLGIAPNTGMTLPLLSHGGSSMWSLGILCGMVLAFVRNRPKNKLVRTLLTKDKA